MELWLIWWVEAPRDAEEEIWPAPYPAECVLSDKIVLRFCFTYNRLRRRQEEREIASQESRMRLDENHDTLFAALIGALQFTGTEGSLN
jgi:hypothetical protein